MRQILTELAQRHVHLSASTVAQLGRRFIVLLALAHRRCAARLQQAMSLQGGYILHLDATYEAKSPMLMTGMDAVMEIVLGNIKLPSEKADGIVPFLRQLKQCFGPPLASVHDMSKGILAAIQEVFPGIPDQPQRTNNLMDLFFRDFKRHCRHKTGCQALGRTLRTMLADTTLVHNLQNPEYLKILLDGQPTLEALFAQIDPATVREELEKAQQNPERVPRALKQFIGSLHSPAPITNFIQNLKSN